MLLGNNMGIWVDVDSVLGTLNIRCRIVIGIQNKLTTTHIVNDIVAKELKLSYHNTSI